jgi:ABC-2 type transport system ATP-binding protein
MNMLDIQGVSKHYAAHTALDKVNLSIPAGCIFGLLGPNGAGKTSLIRIITQITAPDEGQVLFEGNPLRPEHIALMGYLPEERGLYKKVKVGEQLLYLAQLKGLSNKEAMEKLKDWFIRFDIKTWWDKKVEDLSKGMQQKVQFVATVLHQPKLIILDEPFSGFDPINATLIKDEILQLRKQGSTIIFSTHRMESVEELCDYIALINKSKVVLSGATKQIREQYKSNTYLVEGTGKLTEAMLPAGYVLKEVQETAERLKAAVQVPEGSSPNQLLQVLMTSLEVHSFMESIPSMNDIFIRSVTGQTDAQVLPLAAGLTE